MKESGKMALCGMMTALSVVIMALGGWLELGMYASPVLAGLCLSPVRRKVGIRYQVAVWLAVSLLSFILVSQPEQNLMYFAVFGAYPILRPWLQKMEKWTRRILKLTYFNLTAIAVEALVILVLVPEVLGGWMLAALLLVGNVLFGVYDFLIPCYEVIINRYMDKAVGNKGQR